MVEKFSKFKVILVFFLVFLPIIACNIWGPPPESIPSEFGILSPIENALVLAGNPVQILSAFENADSISRVELWVEKVDQPGTAKLLRSDRPTEHGTVLQQWVPEETGTTYTLRVRAYDFNNQIQAEPTRQFRVTGPVAAAGFIPPGQAAAPTDTPIPPPTPTDTPIPTPTPTSTPTPVPTPTPFYPPPPSAPGVPPGPTQAEIPAMSPPVCDAAEYLGVYKGDGDTSRRIFIPTEDQLPAKVVAGTQVHRAWRLRNIGTCTWGPGYELAFYGGRSMGSGGVAFEYFFPTEPARRNVVIDQNQIIVPEGRPNEISVLEVLLRTPSIPGIHQSYWRMRNPQGVYFGPIIGVTMDVVRDCELEPGGPPIYGAPVINTFRILGVDSELAPPGAGETVEYKAEVGQRIVLDWNILNATNFQIVVEDPTGDVRVESTLDPVDRTDFTVTEVGVYKVTLYVDNGSCVVTKTLMVKVLPPVDQQFVLSIALSSTAPQGAPAGPVPLGPPASFKPPAGPETSATTSSAVGLGDVRAEWRHYDPAVNKVTLSAGLRRRTLTKSCLVTGWEWTCRIVAGEWQYGPSVSQPLGAELAGVATVPNFDLCPSPDSISASAEEYEIFYQAQAEINGVEADPPGSNFVFHQCRSNSIISPVPAPALTPAPTPFRTPEIEP